MRFKKTLFVLWSHISLATVALVRTSRWAPSKAKFVSKPGRRRRDGRRAARRKGSHALETDKNGDFVVSKLTPGIYG
jgi:hypothetical protein